jgi:CheY-like chemotaxis protein
MTESKQHLLVVEDEQTLRETLVYNLKREGYEVTASGDGGEALELAREQHFDLIVLDVMLPTLDGLSICRIVRKEQRTPIILLTARSGEDLLDGDLDLRLVRIGRNDERVDVVLDQSVRLLRDDRSQDDVAGVGHGCHQADTSSFDFELACSM